jgi:hypothetical protein
MKPAMVLHLAVNRAVKDALVKGYISRGDAKRNPESKQLPLKASKPESFLHFCRT